MSDQRRRRVVGLNYSNYLTERIIASAAYFAPQAALFDLKTQDQLFAGGNSTVIAEAANLDALDVDPANGIIAGYRTLSAAEVAAFPTTATMAAWLQLEAFPAVSTFASLGSYGVLEEGTSRHGFNFTLLNDGTIEAWRGQGANGSWGASSTTQNLGELYFVVGTFIPGAGFNRIYINGVDVTVTGGGTEADAQTAATAKFGMVRRSANPSSLVQGTVKAHSLTVWDDVLVDAEIMGLYEQGPLPDLYEYYDPTVSYFFATKSIGTIFPDKGDVTLTGKASVAHPGPDVTQGVFLDGVDYLRTDGALNGIAAGKAGIASFMFRSAALSTFEVIFNLRPAGTNGALRISKTADDKLEIEASNAAESTILRATTDSAAFSLNEWAHVIIAWDLATSTLQMDVDGVDVSPIPAILIDDTINYDHNDHVTVGGNAESTAGDLIDAGLGEFFFHTTTLDISSEVNVAKFFVDKESVVKGTQGQLPLGVQPLIYLSGGANDFYYNYGSGGAFDVTGAISSILFPVYGIPDADQLTLTGKAPTLVQQTRRSPGKGALTIVGKAPGAFATVVLAPGKSDLTLVGKQPVIPETPPMTATRLVRLGVGGFARPYVLISAQATVSPGKAQLNLAGKAPDAFLTDEFSFPGTAQLVLTGKAPVVAEQEVVVPDKADLTLTSKVSTLIELAIVNPIRAGILITGKAPDIYELYVVSPGKAALTLNGKELETLHDLVNIERPDKGALVLSGKTLSSVEQAIVRPDTATLSLISDFSAPKVRETVVRAPATAQLVLTGKLSTLLEIKGSLREPGKGQLSLVGKAPALSGTATSVALSSSLLVVTRVDGVEIVTQIDGLQVITDSNFEGLLVA